jgi:hypothetical protein
VHGAPLPHYITQLRSIIALLTLTPSVPLSLKGEGEDNKKEGLPPLKTSLEQDNNQESKYTSFGNPGKLVPTQIEKGLDKYCKVC